MKKHRGWLWDYVIPTETNNFQPHFLRPRIAVSVLALIVAFEGLFLAHTMLLLPKTNYFAAIFATVLIDETNDSRKVENLGSLTPNPILEKAAQLKANDMATKGYFAHNAPDGKTPWYWFDQAGYDYAAAGENLAVNFTDSKDVTNAWLASPLHRANIMNANYTEIGIATAKGTYKGKDAIFVVQEFGRPSLIARQSETASTSQAAVESLIVTTEKTTPKPTSTVVKVAPSTTPVVAKVVHTLTPVELATTTTEIKVGGVAVAGASSEKLSVANTLAPVNSPILETRHASMFEELIASPRQVSTTIYLVIAAILSLILGLAIFIKIRIQHAHIIANGVLLIAIVISLILLNSALGFTQAIV